MCARCTYKNITNLTRFLLTVILKQYPMNHNICYLEYPKQKELSANQGPCYDGHYHLRICCAFLVQLHNSCIQKSGSILYLE